MLVLLDRAVNTTIDATKNLKRDAVSTGHAWIWSATATWVSRRALACNAPTKNVQTTDAAVVDRVILQPVRVPAILDLWERAATNVFSVRAIARHRHRVFASLPAAQIQPSANANVLKNFVARIALC